MRKQTFDDSRWFDLDSATHYEEKTRWNGNNHISLATGTQFDHEALYKSRKGTWILHSWSQWQGSGESWESISEDEAFAWLTLNRHFDAIPQKALAAAEG